MIEGVLLNYGVLGVWTLVLLVERFSFLKQMQEVIKQNTMALTEVKLTIEKCKGVKR